MDNERIIRLRLSVKLFQTSVAVQCYVIKHRIRFVVLLKNALLDNNIKDLIDTSLTITLLAFNASKMQLVQYNNDTRIDISFVEVAS